MIKAPDGRIRIQNSPVAVALHQLADKHCKLPDASIDVQLGGEGLDGYRIWCVLRFTAYAQIEGAALASMVDGEGIPREALAALVDHEMEAIRKIMLESLVAYAKENGAK